MLSAAVRDLHLCHPGRFITDVRTPSPAIWENNPFVTPLHDEDPEASLIECHYPLVHQSNELPYHFIHGFIQHLNAELGTNVQPTRFHGDIHLSPDEVAEIEGMGNDRPYWLIAAGGKSDFTIKWWSNERYQHVVDHFRGRIEFVQVGEAHHYHKPLSGVVDLRGMTNLRQLIRLVYASQGVVTGVSLLMHLAAAIQTPPGALRNRPCVVVAGGREPVQWFAYPHHQVIHRLGALPCCDNGGCWKSRTVPLGDGDEKDNPEALCVDVVRDLPRCMDLITADDVIRAIEVYFEGGAAHYLSEPALASARR